jgi:hypothetical protein
MSDVGNFTYGVARRSQKGPPTFSKDDKSAVDEYTVLLPHGSHPYQATITGLPSIGDDWDIKAGWECDQISWSNTFPSEVWVASVRYRKPRETSTTQEEHLPAGVILKKISYNPTAWQVDVEFDPVTGRPVQNTAGDRFQEALTAELYTTSIVIDTSEEAAPVTEMSTLQGTVNNSSVTIGGITIPAHCGLLTITCKQTDDPDRPFDVTRSIQVANNIIPASNTAYIVPAPGTATALSSAFQFGHQIAVLNTGYRFVAEPATSTTPAVLKRFMDKDDTGKYVLAVDPQMLDEDGAKAEAGTTYYRTFYRYREAAWPSWYPKGAPSKDTITPESEEE